MTSSMLESSTIDELDRQILRCLQVSPRAPFAAFADVLGTSEQTVSRRYRRMHRAGVLRVLGVVNPRPLGQSNWMIRIQCRPSGASSLAGALAQRDDVSWVSLVAGGSEVTCALRSRSQEARDDLLINRLPRSAPVLGMSASVVLHTFSSVDAADDWTGLADALDAADEQRLRALTIRAQDPGTGRIDLDEVDEAILRCVVHDGRASYATLASAAGVSEGRAARRLTALLEAGVVMLDVDVSNRVLGFAVEASLWLSVTPAELDAAGYALAAEPEVAFAAAITGRTNLAAAVVCRDLEALYDFATTKVGAIDGVRELEIAPLLRHVKQAGTLVEGDRLAH